MDFYAKDLVLRRKHINSDDYKSEKMPVVNVDILDGELAWRQHDGGHTDEPNVEHFIKWANRLYCRPAVDLSFVP